MKNIALVIAMAGLLGSPGIVAAEESEALGGDTNWRLSAEVSLGNGRVTALQLCPGQETGPAGTAETTCHRLSIHQDGGAARVATLGPGPVPEPGGQLENALVGIATSFEAIVPMMATNPEYAPPWLSCDETGCP